MCSKTAAFHISIIPHRWYKDHYQDDSFSDNLIFNYKIEDNHTAHKRSTTNKISNNACKVQTDQSSNESEESEIEHKKDIKKSLKSVKNPNKVNIKGQPPKR
ncbi:6754_t:CDS:2 [Cetraspora pellucida]|uniref:6754_t:CDS:1 n=1 Tax=Cetraspora pellucida TaxID=1433469 RepID=A0A9N9AXU9_9GLOM|nr:6754_t:CDS:2 [Cetraspora pellucida]